MSNRFYGGLGDTLGWEEEDESMGKGPLLCEHKDQKSTEENEQVGREENVGT